MIPSDCPPAEVLGRYAAGDLSDPEARTIDDHLGRCTVCLGRLDQLGSTPDPLVAALRRPAAAAGPRPRPTRAAAVGTIVSGYRVLEHLGDGGMGRVYRARHPRLDQEVALKVLRAGCDSDEFLTRFEAERQTLGLMEHPHIARVSDGGMTDAGQPFLVMELVRGVSITSYCTEHKLDLRSRLELFILTCEGVQHAHQKGVIHRDLKPSNILVAEYDGRPVPKVIDFGVAKATERHAGGETEFGTLIGTPEYMSPEQADIACRDIDTRSDIYALGVMLYELLTGDTPFGRLRDGPLTEFLRHIREVEPRPPSKQPGATRIEQAVELDWIVLKCLEKERSRRYQTAAALAEDVRRFLRDEPLVAGRPSRAYRWRKFVHRHRRAVSTAAAFVALLLLGIVVSTWLALQARQAQAQAEIDRDKARIAAGEARSVLTFLQEHVLSAGRPQGQEGGLGREVTVRKAVDAAEPRIAATFADQPLMEASVRQTLGMTYIYVGESVAALVQLERAWQLRQAHLGPDHADTLASQHDLAIACRDVGQLDRALTLLDSVHAKRSAELGADHPETLTSLNEVAETCRLIGQYERATVLSAQTLAARQARLGPDHVDTLISTVNLAHAHQAAGRLKDAMPLYEKAVAGLTASVGKGHPYTLAAMNSLALAYRTAADGRALALFNQVLEIQTEVLGAEHVQTLTTQHNLALMHLDKNQAKLAIPILQRVIDLRSGKLGRDHRDTLKSMSALAAAYQIAGDNKRGLALLEEVVEQCRASLGPDHADTLHAMHDFAALNVMGGKLDRAIAVHAEVLKRREAALGAVHPDTLLSKNNLGWCYWKQKKYDLAIPLWEQAVAGRQAVFGPDHPQTLGAMKSLVVVYRDAGETERALGLLTPAIAERQARLGPDHAVTQDLEKALASAQAEAGLKLLQKRQYAEAEPYLRASLATREREPDAWTTFNSRSLLGGVLLGQQKYAEAEPLLLQGYEGLKQREAQIPAAGKVRVGEALARLVELYEAWDKPEEAARWRQLLSRR